MLKTLDWGGLNVGQMTSMFTALRDCQAHGRQALGALGRELAASAGGTERREITAPTSRRSAPVPPPPDDGDEAKEYEAEPEAPSSPVLLPNGMYVADRPDPNSRAGLPAYHPALTGDRGMIAGGDADERAAARVSGNLNKIFN